MSSIHPKCSATTKSGTRCTRAAVNGTNYCARHATSFNHAQLRVEYEELHPVSTSFAEVLEGQLLSVVRKNDLTLGVPIERRVKTWSSILEKNERKRAGLQTLMDLDDLIGLRLILLFHRDLERVHCHLQDTFTIISHEDTASRLEETQFGYQSVHYVLTLPDSWLAVPTLADFKGLKAEVQVRTVSQHIWAAASHKLQYKQEASVPPPLRRLIHRISAILETVDLELERLLQDRDAYVSDLAVSHDDQPLNVEVLRKILESKWPPQNADPGANIADLLDDLAAFDIRTSSDLISLIDEQYAAVTAEEQREAERCKAELRAGNSIVGSNQARAERGVYFTPVGLTRVALEKLSPDRWRAYAVARFGKR